MTSESRAEYYKKAFEKLENEGKHTWNWAAFFFTVMWMRYRKMYLYSFYAILAAMGVFVTFCLLGYAIFVEVANPGDVMIAMFMGIANPDTESMGMNILSSAVITLVTVSVSCGYYGNSWYRKAIEKKVRKGYHKMEHFCPTSIASAILHLGMFIIMFGDWLKKKWEHVEKKLTSEDKMPTKENIELYLNPTKKEGIFRNIIVLIAIITTIMFQIAIKLSPLFIIGYMADNPTFKEKLDNFEERLNRIEQQMNQTETAF